MADSGIPLLDLYAQNGPIAAALRAAFERVLSSNQFILGPEVDGFERDIEDYLGVPHAIGVSSGTDALLVSLMALGVGPGDEVVTTPFSFFATAGCIVRLGARPVFVDIDPVTYNLDVSRVAAAITPRTKAILPVHLFGQPYDLALHDIAGEIPIVEDAAQAIGARTERGPVGGLGALGCFSFFPSKNLGALGDAGLVTCRDPALAKKVRALRAHGAEQKYEHLMLGGNFRIDALQAALLRAKLVHLDVWAEGRRANAERYDAVFAHAAFPRDLFSAPKRVHKGHVYHQYVVRTSRRDELQKFLASRGIGTAVYYPKPLHLQTCFESLGYSSGAFPEAERACEQVLALPIYPELGQVRVDRIASLVLDFLAR